MPVRAWRVSRPGDGDLLAYGRRGWPTVRIRESRRGGDGRGEGTTLWNGERMSNHEQTREQLLADWERAGGANPPGAEFPYRALFEHNPQPMFVHDAGSLRYLAVNAAAVARYGYTRDEFLALTTKDLLPPEDAGPGAAGGG